MKIYFDNKKLEVHHPILHIDTFTHTNSEDKCKVNLTIMCDYDEYMRLSANTLAANNFFKEIIIENRNQLFILHNSLLCHMTYTNMTSFDGNDIVKLNIELIPSIIECQNLIDVFIE